MGKVRTRILGLEDVEEKQKKKQKVRKTEKKAREAATAPEDQNEKTTQEAKAPQEAPKPPAQAKTPKVTKKTKKRVRGVKYSAKKRLVDKNKKYKLQEAVDLVKKLTFAKFDESVEVHMNVDKVGLKGEVSLPHSTGKTVKVRVMDEATLDQIQKGKIDFDILVTHPSYMPKLAPLAKVLGPRGLMPNPKAGTISDKPDEVAKRFATGTLKWKTEVKFPIIHQIVGKVSADEKTLVENIQSFTSSVGKNHIISAYVSSTMSPSVPLEVE